MTRFLAVYMGSPERAAERPDEATMKRGIAAWHKWMHDHAKAVVEHGGPLGKTKKIAKGGVSDTKNAMTGFIIVEAGSHEAAARMFENHPHFAIFPGDRVEVMECLPIPTGPQ